MTTAQTLYAGPVACAPSLLHRLPCRCLVQLLNTSTDPQNTALASHQCSAGGQQGSPSINCESVDRDTLLMDQLETAVYEYRVKGTHRRTNLAPNAPRDATGKFLKEAIPSDHLTSGPIFDLCVQMLPDQRITDIQVNIH